MSDVRRRRKSHQSGGSDDLSDSFEELNVTKETQSNNTEDHRDSEYDTAGSESDTESQDKAQRESGDGQEEEKPQKKLDDDEDRRNPQYIPKRGTFYEHDDRTADEVNDDNVEAQPEREAKEKKVWKDKEDKWNHDRYNDEEQAPKSHAELIAVYGYDIRNEEGPPRARRRRRYGRGPNKYTRNWEDEDAYGKVAANVPLHKGNVRKNRTGEEFPSLNPKENDDSPQTEEQPVITSAWYSNKNKIQPSKSQNFPPLQQTDNQKTKTKQFINSQANENQAPNERNNTPWKKEPKNIPYIQNSSNVETKVPPIDSEKIVIVKTTPRENKKPSQVQESVSLAASKSRGRGFKPNTNNNLVGSRTIESKPKGRGPGPMNIDNRRNNVEHEKIINDLKHINVSAEGPSYHHTARPNKHFYTQPSSQQHSATVPPRMQPSHTQQQPLPSQQQPPQQPPPQQPPQQDIATNRPKRYSSLRQRPQIAEGPPTPAQPNYPPAPQHTYYPPPQAGSSRAVLESPGYAPGPYDQTAPVPPAAAPMPGPQPVIPIPPGAQPTTYAPHAPPPFLVPPPQFIPPQTAPPPSIINYVAGPNGPIYQPNYQPYNPAAVPPPPPPQDVALYQPQGCTYYSPSQQQQHQQQQPVPLRRPKAAIPILPPPDNLQNQNIRQRSRSGQHTQSQDQQQQQQIQQQQQQQEQLVQQQLQQHQQQLIQEQQQELEKQQQQQQQRQQQQEQQQPQQEQQPQQQEQQPQQQEQKQQQQEQQLQQQEQKQQQKEQETESNNEQAVIKSVEVPTTEIISKVEPVVNDSAIPSINIKDNLDEKLKSVTIEEKPVIAIEENIPEPVVLEAEVEKKETLTKVISDMEDKTTVPTVTEAADNVTAIIEEAKKAHSVVESNIILASEKADEILTKTTELVSEKTETDCGIKESAVIEEAAA